MRGVPPPFWTLHHGIRHPDGHRHGCGPHLDGCPHPQHVVVRVVLLASVIVGRRALGVRTRHQREGRNPKRPPSKWSTVSRSRVSRIAAPCEEGHAKSHGRTPLLRALTTPIAENPPRGRRSLAAECNAHLTFSKECYWQSLAHVKRFQIILPLIRPNPQRHEKPGDSSPTDDAGYTDSSSSRPGHSARTDVLGCLPSPPRLNLRNV